MGKRIIQQRRGKGTATYRSPGHRFYGSAKHISIAQDTVSGKVIDIVKCPGHTSPLAQVSYENGETQYMIAPEGLYVGMQVASGAKANVKPGNTLPLKEIPEGSLVYNIEIKPGDGGKFCRSSGVFAKVISHLNNGTLIQLPSKKQKLLNPLCRAHVGVVSGGGRTEKPFLKAGKRYHAMRARNKLYPIVSGGAMNAVDHPLGNKRSSRKSNAKPVPKNAPPGRKVGMLRPRRTGRKK